MAGYSVSFSVVTYNNEKCIGRVLDSIRKYTKGVPYNIYIVDNGSKDKTIEIIKSRGQGITLIESKKNIGFGRAHNKALDVIDSKYHAIINPDTFIDYDVVTAMADYMDGNDDIGIVSPMVKYPDGRTQRLPKRDPKFIYLLSRRIALRFLKKYRDKYEMASEGPDAAYDIEFASGCFMFVRTELLKKVRGFDERFFLYFKDADLSREIRRFARVQYNPQFYIYHHWERGGARNLKLFCIQILSMLKYFNKWKNYKGTK